MKSQASRAPLCLLALIALVGAGVAPVGALAQGAPDYAAIIAAPDRSDADREADKRRDPLKLLNFAAPRAGMKVLDMGAGGGYSTELMARAVAPSGSVFGQNPADLGGRAKERFEARLKTPTMRKGRLRMRRVCPTGSSFGKSCSPTVLPITQTLPIDFVKCESSEPICRFSRSTFVVAR